MDYKVNSLELGTVFKVCPQCGYQDGFHTMFQRVENSDRIKWLFICPGCHSIFDIGLKVSLD